MEATVARAREEFLAVVGDIRPDLHRYCARLTGSVIEGEDIVQEVLAKAFYALTLNAEAPPLRPWLFKTAHNTAVDFLRSRGRTHVELRDDLGDVTALDDHVDPLVVRAALSQFLTLPVSQRSAVVLKDVLGHSLEETAETMGVTLPSVKALLVRGRAALRDDAREGASIDASARRELDRYASLFNARDWEGLRALIAEDCRLDLVSKSARRGKQVGMYFDRYAKEEVSLRVVRLEGRLALAAHVGGADAPSYFILLDWEGGEVRAIRDFRYVPYIARDAEPSDP